MQKITPLARSAHSLAPSLKNLGYKNGFFGCLADPLACLLTYCCGGIAVGWAAGTLKGAPFDIGSCCCGVGAYRLVSLICWLKRAGVIDTPVQSLAP